MEGDHRAGAVLIEAGALAIVRQRDAFAENAIANT